MRRNQASAERSARRRVAGVGGFHDLSEGKAGHERVAAEMRRTVADGEVVDGIAQGVNTTSSSARVDALVVHARFRQLTIRVQSTLRPARQPGVSRKSSLAHAPGHLSLLDAVRVSSTTNVLADIRLLLRH